jgi:hypothetical protein
MMFDFGFVRWNQRNNYAWLSFKSGPRLLFKRVGLLWKSQYFEGATTVRIA